MTTTWTRALLGVVATSFFNKNAYAEYIDENGKLWGMDNLDEECVEDITIGVIATVGGMKHRKVSKIMGKCKALREAADSILDLPKDVMQK